MSRDSRKSPSSPPVATPHPRSRHHGRYDLRALAQASPELSAFLRPHPLEGETIDFADPAAVLALNRALLLQFYGLRWDLPPGALCPPIPSRADYLHHLADLLAEGSSTPAIPRGAGVTILDIGIGANCIYPLIGAREYGWSFVGTEVNRDSLAWAQRLVADNPSVAAQIECRLQSSTQIFEHVTGPTERFAASICNPPFHASAAEARADSRRKQQNLAANRKSSAPAGEHSLNFGGQAHELWRSGGELAFIRQMIEESRRRPSLCGWFTTLVAKSVHLPPLLAAVKRVQPSDARVIPMRHGQKQTRILAWTFA
jgi:23S rRNA (adenine1618-N6)-methyltransferase